MKIFSGLHIRCVNVLLLLSHASHPKGLIFNLPSGFQVLHRRSKMSGVLLHVFIPQKFVISFMYLLKLVLLWMKKYCLNASSSWRHCWISQRVGQHQISSSTRKLDVIQLQCCCQQQLLKVLCQHSTARKCCISSTNYLAQVSVRYQLMQKVTSRKSKFVHC